MATQTTPQFEVVFKGATMEPNADVAPAGDVTFVLVNESESAHDFALLQLDPDETAWEAWTAPTRMGERGVMGVVPLVAPGGSAIVTYPLRAGRYALVSNSHGEMLGLSLFDLTVQEADGAAA